jgi:hypothetical protein
MAFGMDPEVSRYFKKILSSFSVGLLWMLTVATLGFYFELALIDGKLHWYNILFYLFFIASLICLLYYYYKLWKD